MFRKGPVGFKCGLSAGNYSTITAPLPLQRPVTWRISPKQGALVRTGRAEARTLWAVREAESGEFLRPNVTVSVVCINQKPITQFCVTRMCNADRQGLKLASEVVRKVGWPLWYR
jgi:hypothetical protein